MLIDVKNLTDNNVIEFSFDDVVDFDYNKSATKCNVKITGTVSKTNSNYIVEAKANVVLNLNCDLCLNAFETQLEFDINEVYSDTPDLDKEFWELSDKTIDLKPALMAAIVMNIPMKNVCSPDCKGLCPKCGHNLNEGDCGCDRGYVNPQFEKLLTLFNDK
ncbi:MAG: YceD family protein [Lachnospirales bacterium]